MHTIETPFGEPEFLMLAGSRLYGIETPTSDYDYIGAIVEPETYRVGLSKYKQDGKDYQHGFEQYMFEGDDYEGSVYSLWKLVSMLAEGNPTVLCLMFGTPLIDRYGICTPEFREMVISRKSGHRFMKYMEAQRKSMIGQRAKHVTRQELIDMHGFDTKFAGHLIRLGYQGVEFLTTGTITLPMPEHQRTHVLQIRRGLVSQDDVLYDSETLLTQMEEALANTTLPEEPKWEVLSEWVTATYSEAWFHRALTDVMTRYRPDLTDS